MTLTHVRQSVSFGLCSTSVFRQQPLGLIWVCSRQYPDSCPNIFGLQGCLRSTAPKSDGGDGRCLSHCAPLLLASKGTPIPLCHASGSPQGLAVPIFPGGCRDLCFTMLAALLMVLFLAPADMLTLCCVTLLLKPA